MDYEHQIWKLAREGVSVWNEWRKQNPDVHVILHGANGVGNLRAMNLAGVNLSGADLAKVVMASADLSGANLNGANLSESDLSGAKLTNADLSGAILHRAELKRARLGQVNLSRARLNGANLYRTRLGGADLTLADLRRANLRRANLLEAKLNKADMRNANLQNATLNRCIVTDVMLWETQRAGWSIKGIICEKAYWDEDAKEPTIYSPGEFERLYSDQTCIELFYQGGVSTFELNTLPALLHHLASLHSGASIRLKSIEETGGGAKISISVGDADPEETEKIKSDAMQVYQAQLALRDKETERLQIERDYIERLFLGNLIPAMLSAGTPQNVFNAPVTGVVISSGESKVDFHQIVNDNSALIALLENIMERQTDLGLAAEDTAELEREFQSTKEELGKKTPDKRIVSKGIELFKKIVAETVTKAASKLEDKVVSGDWQGWLHQLNQLIHHWR